MSQRSANDLFSRLEHFEDEEATEYMFRTLVHQKNRCLEQQYRCQYLLEVCSDVSIVLVGYNRDTHKEIIRKILLKHDIYERNSKQLERDVNDVDLLFLD